MYKPSAHLASYFIAGFQFNDGALLVGKLENGQKLKLRAEPDNPFDPEAVAVYYKKSKLGYVPSSENSLLSKMLAFGYGSAFELRIVQVDPTAAPWKQVRVALFLLDARAKRG